MLIVHIITPAGALRRRGTRSAVLLWRALCDQSRSTTPVSGTLRVWLTLERVCFTPRGVCPTPDRVCVNVMKPSGAIRRRGARTEVLLWRTVRDQPRTSVLPGQNPETYRSLFKRGALLLGPKPLDPLNLFSKLNSEVRNPKFSLTRPETPTPYYFCILKYTR